MIAEHHSLYYKMKVPSGQLLCQVPTSDIHQVPRAGRHLEVLHKLVCSLYLLRPSQKQLPSFLRQISENHDVVMCSGINFAITMHNSTRTG